MSIGEKFTGLDMEELIGKPLKAEDDAPKRLDQSTAEFIKEVGFDMELLESGENENFI